MKSAWTAVKFLTIAGRFGLAPGSPEEIGRAAIFFPLIGLLLGLVLMLLSRFLGRAMETELEAIMLVFVLITMTAAAHVEGLQKTADRILAPHHLGDNSVSVTVYGVIAVVLVIASKTRAIEAMGETIQVYLLLAPALARWAILIFLYGPNRANDDSAWRMTKNVTALQLFIATAVTLAMTVYLAGRAGLWVSLAVSTFALLFRAHCQRRMGELSHHHLGALIELSETLSLVLFASL